MHVKTVAIGFFSILALVTQSLSQIQNGQAVQITIMGVPAEEKGKIDAVYPVSDGGTVNMPFIGVVRAAGLSPENLASSIQSAYRNAQIYTSPTIQVIATGAGGQVVQEVVHVGGQVRRTGPLPFQKDLNLYQAIQAAGGPTEFGSIKRVKLFRGGNQRTYDLTQAQFMRVPLEPNDTLEVPQKNFLGQ